MLAPFEYAISSAIYGQKLIRHSSNFDISDLLFFTPPNNFRIAKVARIIHIIKSLEEVVKVLIINNARLIDGVTIE